MNYEGTEQIARFIGLVARSLVTSADQPDYKEVEAPQMPTGGMRAYFGTIPDYTGEVKGVQLSGVTKGAPADQAGLKQGDIIVELAGRKIENIYDYTFALEAVKPNEEISIVVERDGERIELRITPGARN